MLDWPRYDELSSAESRLAVATERRSSISPARTNHLTSTTDCECELELRSGGAASLLVGPAPMQLAPRRPAARALARSLPASPLAVPNSQTKCAQINFLYSRAAQCASN